MLSVEFGSIVHCNYGDIDTYTHRPAGSSDPWFCSLCGSTTHEETQ